ncbi:MAG TPA: hypothetical protein VFB14_10280 [Bryobacteraceae bacterium]|jgi:hypothetical protein|nr:hypothetical protein [Bryobacteraceae bacterium]
MRQIGILCLALALLPFCAPASDFDWLVREFSRESGARQVHIPFFGLARFAVAVAHPAGTSGLKLAIFERCDLEAPRFTTLVDTSVGPSWKPMIRVRSRNSESTNIYERQSGRELELLITSLEREEATFVQVRIQPQALMRFVDEHSEKRR